MTTEKALVPKKEEEEIKNQVLLVQEQADGLVIVSDEDMSQASDILNAVKKVEKTIIDRKKEITGPLMKALASARDLFKPFEVGHVEAKKTIKAKMLEYSIVEEERIEKEKERVEKRVEKGTMRVDTAVKKIEEAGEIKKSFDGSSSNSFIRVATKIRITDESLIPREYLIPDMKAITEAVLKGKQTVAGVETYEEKSIVGRTR
tara:strand:- start:29 stop:640 length:612 start_codon:yes stop_codon:yes gene_type:complete